MDIVAQRKHKREEDWHKASMERRYAQTIRQRETKAYVLAATTEVLMCDSVPLSRYRLQSEQPCAGVDLVEEEYERVAADDEEILWLAQGVIDDKSNESGDDSNNEADIDSVPSYKGAADGRSQISANGIDEGYSSEREDYMDYTADSDSDW